MHGLRSCPRIVALTACALALLSVPVIALGKGPQEVKGGGTDTAATVVPPQANVAPPPPGQVDNPAAAPKPAPPYGLARGHAPQRPSSEPAEGSGQPASPPGSGSGSPDSGSRSPNEPSRSPSGRSRSAGEPDVTGGIDLPSAAAPENGDGGVPAAVVSDTVELPAEANPETLPFTGLPLALMTLAGLAALAAGLALRRTVTR
jgi:hypothetical protein